MANKKQLYKVIHQEHEYLCEATSKQSACRKAFKAFIALDQIKSQPQTDISSDTSFANTNCFVVPNNFVEVGTVYADDPESMQYENHEDKTEPTI